MRNLDEKNIHELDALIGGSHVVTVAVHTHPDGDALGSGMALVSYLRKRRGVDAALAVPDPVPYNLQFVVEGQECLVWTEDPDAVSRRIGRSDLLFCLDCNSFDRTASLRGAIEASTAAKVLIDHHLNPSREDFDLVFSECEISSASELLFWILLSMPGVKGVKDLPEECRNALMCGMTTDTNNFANSVYPTTFRMASMLAESGTDRDEILSRIYDNYRENRLRLMGYIFENEFHTTPEGAAWIVLRKDVQERFDMLPGETEGFVNMPLSIAGVRMSIFLTEQEDNFRVSIRSKKGTSANSMAAKYFNGGGHENAAGGKLFFPQDIPSPDDVQAYILKVIPRFFER